MLHSLKRVLRGLPAYLWGGWGAACSLLFLLALWEGLSAIYGALILPDPLTCLQRLGELLAAGKLGGELLITARRASIGLGLALAAGSLLGLCAGLSATVALLARPLITVLLGTPPIAWLVLALLWFGMGDGTPVFTVFVACFPIVFAGALQGARTLDAGLRDMARACRLPLGMRLREVYGPHILSYLFPAAITALGSAWKVVVMAELLASERGVGAALAISRAQLDTAATLAWVVAVLGCLLCVEYGLLEPLRLELERWRENTR
ncbi:MAG: ABC transporter permease [Candidatus Dactylopiibacterium carminicum]|uniref:ABC transporter permease n=1 Tax=Candidatus Dactylopiibacterium carminicum TaxID=857335 RepID=UPI000BD3824D|nr:ABC transporter permease subunit [Candidatus Dactylopiibacterium carminicum]PAT00707.1 MAG: ABC transporter permease [Candidatus Dactylopiibacterium carminicum]